MCFSPCKSRVCGFVYAIFSPLFSNNTGFSVVSYHNFKYLNPPNVERMPNFRQDKPNHNTNLHKRFYFVMNGNFDYERLQLINPITYKNALHNPGERQNQNQNRPKTKTKTKNGKRNPPGPNFSVFSERADCQSYHTTPNPYSHKAVFVNMWLFVKNQ